LEEADYFGLQYALANGDLIWLNLRNRLSKHAPSSLPFNLFFKVKYFVPPYNLVQEETNFNASTTPCKYACFWPDCRAEMPHEVLTSAANYHKQLTGMSVGSAEYELLRIAHDEVQAFGVYFYRISDTFGNKLLMGAGPKYVALCRLDSTFIEQFLYCRLKAVTIAAQVLTLNLLEDDGSVKMRNYELLNKQSADCLYRSIIEIHCFFSCDNISEDVLNRTNPSFTLFDHNGVQ
uniref:FERM_N domain-containing protein n=1 Tax=Hymenolepis diminuta TaxID=6216 RepID=A0A0R3SY69_HYMDI